MPARPKRQLVQDELGLDKTLPAGPADFEVLCGAGPQAVLLGLGPEPERLSELAPGASAYVECPELAAQYGPDWRGRIPAGLRELSPAELPALARTGARLVLYRPGLRAFPSFWGPILARAQVALLARAPAPRPRLAWIPGGEGGLLRIELREALQDAGWQVRLTGEAGAQDFRALLAGGECPSLVLSVNFSGLDPLGEAFHLLAAAGARVAVWCVDTPLHQLSALKSRSWTRLPLFVTDQWSVEPLRRLGAQDVRHLPLAARARDLAPGPDAPPRQPSPRWSGLADRLVFVGRSAFPGKEGFFAGCTLPRELWTEAQAMLERGERPDLAWWLDRLDIRRLWPGTEARGAGFCAEETGRAWRTLCLRRAAREFGPVTVFGDEGWRALLPELDDLRGFVDYYAALPDITASAGLTLNLTNPLLPRGLTQRHFDAWAWGGTLVTDAAPGLDLFPPELTRPVTFRTPAELPGLCRTLAGDAPLRRQLQSAWRDLLRREHTYARRLFQILEAVDLAG